VVIALAFVLNIVVEYFFVHPPYGVDGQAGGAGANALIVSAGMTALAWRRQFPLVVAAIVLGTVIYSFNNGELSQGLITPAFSLILVAFTIGAECRPPRGYFGLALLVVPSAVQVLASDGPSDWFGVLTAVAFLVGPWTVGWAFHDKAVGAEEALARARQLEEENQRQAVLAARAERARIARELHDIVSHSISVVTIQTQAVRRRLGPENEREAADLKAVETTAREALAEMRRLFGVLRADDETASLAPQPGLGDLGRLVASSSAGGVDVRLVVSGEAPPLSPGIDLAAFRIAQEGLTNAVRHSGASSVTLTVRYLPDSVAIEVEDNGRGMASARSGGHGLVGIRERALLYHGTVELGESGCGGVRLSVRLPLRETP
jgi:signal transduction histidine kinase